MNEIPNFEITSTILHSCFEVINELGSGFLETIYKKALVISLREKGRIVEEEKIFDVYYKNERIGIYKADIVVDDSVIVEAKCCNSLLPENQAQVINYLKASNILTGLLVNFGNQKLEYKRLYHPRMKDKKMWESGSLAEK